MSDRRRRNCAGCGRWLDCSDDEKCLVCDPECGHCTERQSDVSQPFVTCGGCRVEMFRGCVVDSKNHFNCTDNEADDEDDEE